MTNFKDPEKIKNFKEVFAALDNIFGMDIMDQIVRAHVSIPTGMNLDDVAKTELITFSIVITKADGEISQQEIDLLNELFDLSGNRDTYESLAKTVPSNFLSTVPTWVRALALMPIQSASAKADMARKLIDNLGAVIAEEDGAEVSELGLTAMYSKLCKEYLLNN